MTAFRRIPGPPRGFEPEGLERRLYVLPAGIVAGEAAAAAVVAGQGWPLADGRLAFTAVGLLLREAGGVSLAVLPFTEAVSWAEDEGLVTSRHVSGLIHRIGGSRKPWGGLALDRPLVMGIVNVTPDSFSDGGEVFEAGAAIARGVTMVEAGAALVDVGGESTRPGSETVSDEEEARRVVPVVRGLAERGIVVSIDTRHARVMAAALEAGARLVNDVSALADPEALSLVARAGAAVCLMHMQGEPKTMQAAPSYACAPLDVYDMLADRVAACLAAGIPRENICVDPGIGFGKMVRHNAEVLGALALYHGLGCPLLLGVSRKSFVAQMSRGEPAGERLPGTLAAELAGLDAGVHILRAHDVPQTLQALRVWQAIRSGGCTE
ncbi:MAG: dihydropteroate synthase [Magnetospirillum sp.]|nr:dihydropteroate synthase [Magnetospirillum sp.]